MAKGDHIFVRCRGYSHHGIDVGDGRVVHFDANPWQTLTAAVTRRIPTIRLVSMEEFTGNRQVYVRRYEQADSPDVAAQRALSRVGERGYCVFSNNCEHFAVWCKTGRSHSTQVFDFVDAARPLVNALPTATMVWRYGRRLPLRLRPVAYGAAVALAAGAFAQRYVENRLVRSVRGES